MIRKLRRRLTFLFSALTGAVLAIVLGISLFYSINQARFASAEKLSTETGYLVIGMANSGCSDLAPLQQLEKTKPYTISVKLNGAYQQFYSNDEAAPREKLVAAAEAALSSESDMEPLVVSEAVESLPYLFSSVSLGQSGYYFNSDNSMQLTSTSNTYPAEELMESNSAYGIIDTESEFIYPAIGAYSAQPADAADGLVSLSFDFLQSPIPYPTFELDSQTYRVSSLQMTDVSNQNLEIMIVENMAAEGKEIFLICMGYSALLILGMLLLIVINWFLSKLILKPTEDGIKQQAAFVAAASHELKSPITVVKSSLSAAEIADTPEDAEKYRQCAYSETQRMGRLVNDLLLLAGSDGKKWDIHRQPFDVDTLMIDITEQYSPVAKKKSIELKLNLPEAALGEINGDRERIHQILSILIDNAIEYSPEHSRVSLSVNTEKKKLVFSVADQGPGISQAETEKIFTRFYRTDKSRSDKSHFGLGLSIAKELAELHGGNISVKSPDSGGSIFYLKI